MKSYRQYRRLEALYLGDAPDGPASGLVVGQWYVVRWLDVGVTSSLLALYGVPGRWNTIHFVLDVREAGGVKFHSSKPCGCGAMFALKALVEAAAARWADDRSRDYAFIDALGRAQALTGLPPFDWGRGPKP